MFDSFSPAIQKAVRGLNRETPLVHHITNQVVMRVTADATLAMGGSPIMAMALEEVGDLAAAASALVLNIGTLTAETVRAMLEAGKSANRAETPVIFDPVGAGATSYRMETAREILREVRVSVIRGNSSEVGALAGETVRSRGVDGVHAGEIRGAAGRLARETEAVVAVTGPADYVTDGERYGIFTGGDPWMGRITGSGCTVTGAVALFSAVLDDSFWGTLSALAYCGRAGEMAARNCRGPGDFRTRWIDALYRLRADKVAGESWPVEVGRLKR